MHKILIFSPFETHQAIFTYPFLKKVRENYPESEINVLCLEGQSEYYGIWEDLNLKIFEIPEKDYKLVFLHKFAVNLHDVFNINLFIDLSCEFLGAMVGMFFRAEQRVGFHKDLRTSMLYTDSIEYKTLPNIDKRIKLLSEKIELADNIETLFKSSEKDSTGALKFFFHFNHLVKEKESLLWIDISNDIHDQEIIYWCEDEIFEELNRDLNKKSEYFNYFGNYKDLRRYLKECDVVLTDKQWVYYVCQAFKTPCFLFKNVNDGLETSSNFPGPHSVITFEEESILDIVDNGEKKAIKVVDEVIDFIHEKIAI